MRTQVKRICLVVMLFLMLPAGRAVSGSTLRTVAFYAVKACEKPPTLDGVLDEPRWQTANAASTHYEYWKMDPGPGVLDTLFRMVYTDNGRT